MAVHRSSMQSSVMPIYKHALMNELKTCRVWPKEAIQKNKIKSAVLDILVHYFLQLKIEAVICATVKNADY